MAKETMIVFVYDTEYCKDETYDPINAVLYFHPSWVSDVQKVALCGQLMGTSHFLKYCFFRPKIIALQNGKFMFKEFGRFLVAIGTDRNISDYLLEHRASLLISLIEFFHRDLQTIYDQFPSNKYHRNVSEKLYHIFGTYLPILQYNGNIFQNVPKLRMPKIAGNIFLDAMQTLQSCQQTKGVLGGAILYHNKIVASQLSDIVTKNIVFTDPHRIKSTAEMISVNFHVPVGVQMIVVYIPVDQYQLLSSDAYRSQNLQTQDLSTNAHPTHFQKRKMKRDRSIIFTNIPEENNCEQTDPIDEIVIKTKRTIPRPTHLQLKDVTLKDLPETSFTAITFEESGSYPEFIGRTSVCSTPMTENRVLHGNGIMSICVNPTGDSTTPKMKLRNTLKIDFDKMFSSFISNPQKMERRNSFTDLQDSVKKISKKLSLKKSSLKTDVNIDDNSVSSVKSDYIPVDRIPGHKTILRAVSDPIYPASSDTEHTNSSNFLQEFQNISDESTKKEDEAVELVENSRNTTIALMTASDVGAIDKATIAVKQQVRPKNDAKTPLDKKSLSLPLKAHGENITTTGLSFDRRRMSGIQLTPLMAKLTVLALNEERGCVFSSRDNNQCVDFATPTERNTKYSGKYLEKDVTEDIISQQSDDFQKVELYICGQQNMTMFLLLEQGSGNKQEIVQTMFDKCVAKLTKMESHLYQTLNVNMMQGVSDGVYSLICIDSKWDTLLNNGPWAPLDQSFLEHMHTDFSKGQIVTDIFLRTNDSTLYGYKSGRTEFFFKESAHYFSGIPSPSDPMGTIATRAKSRLEEDFSIVLF